MAKAPARRPRVGDAFNPWRRFHISPIPEALSRYQELPWGAKGVYGRLLRYAGRDALCFPAVASLAKEVGLGERQVQSHLNSLEAQGFIKREPQFDRSRGQTSNNYKFLWHVIFEEWEMEQQAKQGVNSNSPSPVNAEPSRRVNFNSPKESQLEESHPGKRAGEGQGFESERVPFGSWDFYERNPSDSNEDRDEEKGELHPMHWGSPKQSQGDQDFPSTQLNKGELAARAARIRLKKIRDAANAADAGTGLK